MDDAKTLLWLAIEDYSGLWEAVWQLRTVDPQAGSEALAERARNSLAQLLERGLIRLYRCEEPYGDLSDVDDREIEAILAEDGSWMEPAPGSVSIRFSGTTAGQEACESWPG